MADHVRKQALDAIVAAMTSLTTTNGNVFLGRVSMLQRTEVPGLIVRSGNERIDVVDLSRPRFQERHFQVDVVVCVRETDDYEVDLQKCFAEVEVALAPGSVAGAFGGKSITLRNIEAPQRMQNEITYVQAAMNYEVFYLTAETAPDVAL